MTGTPGGTGDDGQVSEETRLMAERILEQAATFPTPERLAAMAAEALRTPGRDMSAEEIRELAASAITQAQQVSYYLKRLAALLDEPAGEGRG